ncbi:MAG: AAA family ATPase [Solirubrobacterales bacterium]
MLQISQRPLQPTAADATLFVDRASELERLARSVRHRFNSLVLGERGSGKTSLLRRLQGQLADQGVASRFVEASGATTVEELVDLIYEAVHGRRRDPTERLLASLEGGAGIGDDLRRLTPRDAGQLVMFLDSINHPELVQHLFGRLRDDVWQLPFTWVVAGNRSERGRYLEPPADSFFDAVVDIGELDEEHAADLLRRRAHQAGADDAGGQILLSVASELAMRVKPRTPRNILAAARDVLVEAADDPTQWVTNLHALQRRATELGRPAAMLFTELMDLGPVSPSDRQLLERLGWTRARAAQVFKQLEQAGLVVVSDEAPDGPGRPRKLYAANSRYHAVEDLRSGS